MISHSIIISGRVGRCSCGGWLSEWKDTKGRFQKCDKCKKRTRLRKFSVEFASMILKPVSKSK